MVATHQLRLHLASDAEAPGRARHAAAAHPALAARLQADVALLVSEAVTNAVRYGGADGIDLAMDIDDGVVRVTVRDGGDGVPIVREAGPQGGYGLGIVGALAAAWGTGPGELWFELR